MPRPKRRPATGLPYDRKGRGRGGEAARLRRLRSGSIGGAETRAAEPPGPAPRVIERDHLPHEPVRTDLDLCLIYAASGRPEGSGRSYGVDSRLGYRL